MREKISGIKAKADRPVGQIYHLLVKLATVQPDSRFKTDDVIKSHNTIANHKDTVWLGKSGRSLSNNNIELLKSSIRTNKPLQLILAVRISRELVYFEAKIHDIQTFGFRPPAEQVPEYYRHMIDDMSIWIEVGPLVKLQKSKLDKLIVASSQRPIVEVVPRTQTSIMIVCEQK